VKALMIASNKKWHKNCFLLCWNIKWTFVLSFLS